MYITKRQDIFVFSLGLRLSYIHVLFIAETELKEYVYCCEVGDEVKTMAM